MHRRFVAVVAALALVTPPGMAQAAGVAEKAPTGTAVTLVTGDTVRIVTGASGQPALAIYPAPGRDDISFQRQDKIGGDVLVVPSDAAPLLAAGRLDPRLFNVTGLVRMGYTDKAKPTLPLIVTHRPGIAAPEGRRLSSVNGVAMSLDKRRGSALWDSLTDQRTLTAGVTKIWLDGVARTSLDVSVPQIGAPAAWQAGYTGAGITVGILDSGVKGDHPDLAGRLVEQRDFTDTLPQGGDDDGHGTHVAGIVAGVGAKYRGVAPDAKLISGKVCTMWGCAESEIIAGMEWIAPKVRVVNMSLGGNSTDGTDPMSQAVDNLTAAHGTLFVIAAGNSGGFDQVAAPAAADAALAVGNVTKDDETNPGSSRGPRTGDYAVKPDIAAPGTGIVAARAAGTPTGDANPVDENYTRLTGTSMASPHVAGAAALLAQQHPDWSASQLKPTLMSTAKPTAGVLDQGAGRVDVARAVSQRVTSPSGSVSYGFFAWPYDEKPVGKTVTYRNDGTAPVTLDLALTVTGPDGPAPAGMFTTSGNQVTVPAGGTADVTVTANVIGKAIGQYSGRLTATAPGVAVQTALAAYLEPESYDLSIKVIGRNGTFEDAAIMPVNSVTGDARFSSEVKFDESTGIGRIRLPKGNWDLNGYDLSTDPNNEAQPRLVTALSKANVVLDRDTSVTLDARAGRPVKAVVDKADARLHIGEVGLMSGNGQGHGGVFAQVVRPNVQLFAVPVASRVTDHPHSFIFGAAFSAKPPPGSDPSGYVYNLAFSEPGGVPADLTYEAPDRTLAAVRTTYHAQGATTSAARFGWALYPGIGAGSRLIDFQNVTVPSRRTEYFTANPDITWFQYLQISTDESSDAESHVSQRTYRAGPQAASWNRAPVGPAFGHPDRGWGVVRNGSELDVSLTLFSGSDPGSFAQPANGVTGTTTLSRDGVVLGTSDQPGFGSFTIPDTAGRYSLRAVASRDVPWSVIGTKTDATWTFREPGATAPAKALPLLGIRASGDVDDQGRAPSGEYFPLVLTAGRQPGAPGSARLAALTVDVSYDDGAKWTRARTGFSGSTGVALLRHPDAGKFVSLRITARDTDGNTVTQTVTRAYQLR